MKLVVTIDVEEEGLFSGRYDPHDTPVSNVAELAGLDPIFREWEIRPTLLATYPVMSNERCADLLVKLRDKWHGEIGAHLHHWNTPPMRKLPYSEPVPSAFIPPDLMSEKLETLLAAIRAKGIATTSFRMGRFNIGPRMFSVLEKAGITVDSSVAPMRKYYGGPDHLSALTDPYFPDPDQLLDQGNSPILEVPMTIVPVFKKLGSFLDGAAKTVFPERWISWFAMNLGSLPVQPMWTGLRRLKAGVKLHAARGGQVLTIFFHSSELMPGGCPQHQTTEDVDRFKGRLMTFFAWLRSEMPVESFTLTELGERYRRERCAKPHPSN
jgi:hypothetical protein